MESGNKALSKNSQGIIFNFLPYKYQLIFMPKSPHLLEAFILQNQNIKKDDKQKINLFTNYLSIYTHLYSKDSFSKYVNYFLSHQIQNIEIKSSLSQKENEKIKILVLSYFFKNFQNFEKKSKKFKISFKKENDIKFILELLQAVSNSDKFKYILEGDRNLPFEKYPKLFHYIKEYRPNDFFVFTQDILLTESLKKGNTLFEFTNVVVHNGNIDDLVEYSKQNNNYFRRITSPESEISQIEESKIKELVELNHESLIEAPKVPFSFLTSCSKLEAITMPIIDESGDQNENLENFSKINLNNVKKVNKIIASVFNQYIPILNKITNLKEINFASNYSNHNIFEEALDNLNGRMLRKIFPNYNWPNNFLNFSKFFEKFTNFEKIIKSNDLDYLKNKPNVYDVFKYKNVAKLEYNDIYKLMKNLVHRDASNYITLLFTTNKIEEIDAFFSLGKEKYQDVLEKFEEIIFAGEKENSTEIPYVKYLNVGNYAGLKLKINHIDCINFNKVDFSNQQVMDYLIQTQPYFIKIDKKNFNLKLIDLNQLYKTEIILKDNELAGIKHCNKWKFFE